MMTMARAKRMVHTDTVPRLGFVGHVARRHGQLLVSAALTIGFGAMWLYVRYHHVVLGSGFTSVDCGRWGDRLYTDGRCIGAFGDRDDILYLVGTVGGLMAFLYLVSLLARTLRRPPAFARGGNVVLRAIGPRDATALAATIDADVIVENRMPFNTAVTLRRFARWFTLRTYVAICNTDTGRIVGAIALTADLEAMEATLGIWIGPHDRGKGHATAALAAYAPTLHDRGFSKVIADTSIDNRAMRTALEHAGFESTGTMTFTFHNGDSVPAVRYVSLSKSARIASAAGRADR
jgi:RimJ/RimL family protein N-acetyltransferase